MNLIIRDDDTNYFTKPEDLEYWYKDIWDKVPIYLACIPFVKAIAAEVPLDKRNGNTYPISDNKFLCYYLKNKIKEGKIIIWQHGITHETKNGKYEFEYKTYPFCGREELESAFDTKVKVFVAPHDRFSKQAVRNIESYKMDICRGYSPLPREFRFTKQYIKNFIGFFVWYLYFGTTRRPLGWTDYGKHKEIYSYRLDELTFENIDDIIKFHKGGILCVTVHNRTMNKFSQEKLRYLVEHVKNSKRT